MDLETKKRTKSKRKLLFLTVVLAVGFLGSVKAQTAIDSLESRLRQTTSDSLRFRLLNQLSVAYEYLNFSKAEHYSEESVRIAEEKNWSWAKMKAYNQTIRL